MESWIVESWTVIRGIIYSGMGIGDRKGEGVRFVHELCNFSFFFFLIDLFIDLLTNFRAKLSALSILDFSLNSFFLFFFLGGEFFFFFFNRLGNVS